jgi:hypothetical protein
MFHATICRNSSLLVRSRTVKGVLALLNESGLYALSPEELYETLASCSADGLCSRDEFVVLFSDLTTSSSLFAIFDMFDRTDSGSCDVIELSIGLSVLCQGCVAPSPIHTPSVFNLER